MISEVYTPDVIVDDDFLTEECGFPVTATLKGHYFETEFYDKDGNLRAVTGHPSSGIHLELKGETVAIGLWTLVFDPETGEFVSQEYHGNFDVPISGQAAAVCDALAG